MPTVPRPAALKLLNGRHDGVDSGGRKVALPPPFERGAPDPPPIVRVNPEALDSWNRIVPELSKLDLLKYVDQDALTAYCLTYSRLILAQADIDVNGITIETLKGGVQRNPACGVADACTKEIRQWAQEFGLTPSAEGRLAPPPGANDDNADAAFDN